ncbi:hypothetical protein PGTUg99_006626 [Puccinia graminis f. sp. tritici]|uniref:Uncharacterized protein n=1 Tax=Puccinia graminis f. sp. tritici TaxID=56615 RepID=A0A5B0NGY5_PUCGR|nr:hypothetical protein PGTUg99_006626 [Puccinia graminis f. sp. tritici]
MPITIGDILQDCRMDVGWRDGYPIPFTVILPRPNLTLRAEWSSVPDRLLKSSDTAFPDGDSHLLEY